MVSSDITQLRHTDMSNLKRIRESKGLTQAGLAEKSGVNKRMVEHYEQGFHDINKAEARTIFKLARALKCKMEDVIEKDQID